MRAVARAGIVFGLGALACLTGLVPAVASVPANALALPANSPQAKSSLLAMPNRQVLSTPQPQAEETESAAYLPLVYRGFEVPTATPTPSSTDPTPTATATDPEPTPVGPLGGTFTSLAIDPNQNDNIYAGSFTAGVFKSFDQGLTWYPKSVGLNELRIQSLATHPVSSMIVYAGTYTGGVYKSVNGGESWSTANGGLLDTHIVYDIEIDPVNPDILYTASRKKESLVGYLAKSLDGGTNWTIILRGQAGTLFSANDYFYDVDINPQDTSVIYLTAHEHGFYKSSDAGASFSPINSGVTDLSARTMALDPAKPSLVFGGVWHDAGCYVSLNAGSSWTRKASGLPTNVKVMRLSLDLYGGATKRVFACTFGNGLYSSDNSGTNWSSRGLSGQELNDFIIADGNPQRWYAALQSNGLRKSSTYGSSWVGSTGTLKLNTITGFETLKADLHTIYAGIYGRGVYRVGDAGQTWTEFNAGLADFAVTQLLALDETLYALTDSGLYRLVGGVWENLSLPQSALSDQAAYVAWLETRVDVPDNLALDAIRAESVAEQTTRSLQQALPLTGLAKLEGRLIAGTAGQGLWCRDEAGWTACGLTGESIRAMGSDPNGETVLVFSCSEAASCAMSAVSADGIKKVNAGLEGQKVNGIVAAGGEQYALSESGLFVWSTQRSRWRLLGLAGLDVLSLAVSPHSGCRMAAGTQDSAYLSEDCGRTWQLLSSGLGEWQYSAVSFAPKDPSLVLMGSREAGAFVVPIE